MTDTLAAQAVLRAEPDAYDMAKAQLMGRQAAGYGFLRAAVQAREGRPIHGFTPSRTSADRFADIVRGIDPTATADWVHSDHLHRFAELGMLYIADATVAKHARLRLRVGPAAFSICGVTHTTASIDSMDQITGALREAVMPWDALICTSSAVVETVRRVQEAEAEHLRWRFGEHVRPQGPQLPLIPLGVHCDDFAFAQPARTAARAALGLADDEVAGLFVGRLAFHAKAHPMPILRGFQLAAEQTGQRMAVIFCGWFAHGGVEAAYRTGAEQFAPDVRVIFVDGRNATSRDQAWAAADLFASPSDSIQETFGLTPIEAMAAGLPVVASDWDGYKDTVRDGVDGFRVRTWAPGAGMGQALARAYETGAANYDQYCWLAGASTAVDISGYARAIATLAANPDLRRRMGEVGRRRTRELFDWPVVYRQYQELWADLNARRAAAVADPATAQWLKAAPKASAARLDPFYAFGHYPTAVIGSTTRLAATPGATTGDVRALLAHPLFGSLAPPLDLYERLFIRVADGDITVGDAARHLSVGLPTLARCAATLVKAGVVGIAETSA
ncbi:glycosyltransferase family 4 protein [Phenylobacterium sp. SCN 70-31]|uniref:glycosyltransferase family 4 protein n=1 Tax=Phenylobacterium sp. SCN 70-31 TaxID=1660129 RepID=UPI000B0E06D5|nr:glycosyltransferase family 4 protein [Phenylobacterium sp. SCN 70-31]